MSKKECRKCGSGIADINTYCRSCYIEFKAWLKQADYKVVTFEQAGHKDYHGYEDKPPINGEPKKIPKAI